ncbi:isochorismatase family protein [Hymenobacter siberiensis]|uniref:isochorismatase family protein n=1 Tax=Hymenobacter siberiensis TaxID=2848396 RepID=UPI001D01B8AF|nr:isochorismatase family protein [Hymenobacter siberiensis]
MSKVLIIVDVQNDYFDNGAMELVGALQASENVKRVLAKFRKKTCPSSTFTTWGYLPTRPSSCPEQQGPRFTRT